MLAEGKILDQSTKGSPTHSTAQSMSLTFASIPLTPHIPGTGSEGLHWILARDGCTSELRNSKIRVTESSVMGSQHACPFLSEKNFITVDSKHIYLLLQGDVICIFQGCLSYKYPRKENKGQSVPPSTRCPEIREPWRFVSPTLQKMIFTSHPKYGME